MTSPAPLTQSEQDSLLHHLSVIKVSFALMIKSLAIIYSQRLYRGIDGTRTWQNFCETELNFGERLGYYFVKAYSVLETIEAHNATAPDPLPLPSREAQTRALLSTPPDLIIPIWQSTIAKYGDNATAKNIHTVANNMTVSECLILRGVTDGAVLSALTTLAEKSEHGRNVVTELLNTGHLQIGDEDEAIPLKDVRVADLKRYQDDIQREAMMRRVAESGGINIVIYPDNPTKTAGALVAHMPIEQVARLRWVLAEICQKVETPTN